MSDNAQNLRQAAEEIRREGHAGWGNACEWAADEIERLTAERDNLRDNLQSAVHRIEDMLMGDDGQAWKEAQKFLEMLKRKDDLHLSAKKP